MQLVINVLKFAITFGVGSSILLSTKVFIKHSVENVKRIEEFENNDENKKLEGKTK